MLPTKTSSQNIYIEIKKSPHGNPGWELGSCVWSPLYSTNGRTKTWKLMEEVNVNDIVIHLLTIKDAYYFYGIESSLRDNNNK